MKNLYYIILFFVFLLSPSMALSETKQKTYRIAVARAFPLDIYDVQLEIIKDMLEDSALGNQIFFPEELDIPWTYNTIETYDMYRKKAQELLQRNDYDIILSFGTIASTILLQENSYGRPIIGVSINDPVNSKLVESIHNSGNIFFTTSIHNQDINDIFLLYHRILGFKKLGVMYHNSDEGQGYTLLLGARKMARDLGFTLLEETNISSLGTKDEYLSVAKSLVAQGVDVIFIPTTEFFLNKNKSHKEFFDYLYKNNVLSVTVDNRYLVQKYAVLGFVITDDYVNGAFHANQVIKILQGSYPIDLPMIVTSKSKIIFNFDVMSQFGLSFSTRALFLCDELYMNFDD